MFSKIENNIVKLIKVTAVIYLFISVLYIFTIILFQTENNLSNTSIFNTVVYQIDSIVKSLVYFGFAMLLDFVKKIADNEKN